MKALKHFQQRLRKWDPGKYSCLAVKHLRQCSSKAIALHIFPAPTRLIELNVHQAAIKVSCPIHLSHVFEQGNL